MPCSEKRARQLLQRGQAVVHRLIPFTIRLKVNPVTQITQELRLKLDPGSKTTGMAVLHGNKAIFLAKIKHKPGIKQKLDHRRSLRRSRRNRKTRYRQPRFLNRKRNSGWLPPSLEARVNQTLSAVQKLRKLLPITAISTEHAKFDTQLMQNPNIQGVEYQQGELQGYEVREYLLEKWGRKCAYCGATNVPLEIEHIIPKARGGSDRISNLTLVCCSCNQEKNALTAAEFGYPQVQAKAKTPLKDAAMMNSTRWRLFEQLKATSLPVECGTGARTKMNRIALNLPKEHYYDACCVGQSTPDNLQICTSYVQTWVAVGRGTRQMCNPDKYGFPRGHRQNRKLYFGFQTGDKVKANILKGKYAGLWKGRVAVRASGFFDLKDDNNARICQGISYKHCRLVQRASGWQYIKQKVS